MDEQQAPIPQRELDDIWIRAIRYAGRSQASKPAGRIARDSIRLLKELRRVTEERDRAVMTLASITTDDGGS